jgi:hypothetical protein
LHNRRKDYDIYENVGQHVAERAKSFTVQENPSTPVTAQAQNVPCNNNSVHHRENPPSLKRFRQFIHLSKHDTLEALRLNRSEYVRRRLQAVM